MSEFLGEPSPTLHEAVFPVSYEAFDKLLLHMAASVGRGGSDSAFFDELMDGGTPISEAYETFTEYWKIPEQHKYYFGDGYSAAHKLLSLQAQTTTGADIPDGKMAINDTYFEELQATEPAFYHQKEVFMYDHDPNFYQTMKGCLNLRLDDMGSAQRHAFILGGFAMYDMVDYQTNSLDFERMFNPTGD